MAKEKVIRAVAKVPDDKQKAAQEVREALAKKYGAGTVMRLGSQVGVRFPCIPTGIYSLDQYALGIGGVPRGRIVEIYGPESSGKTTTALQVIAQAQAEGGLAAFVDAEHALDPTWADTLGVDVDELDISQPDSGEQALEIAESLVRSGAYSVIVIDSVAALVPQAELNGEMGDSHVGLQARLMSQALRKLTAVVAVTGTTVIFINQIREKIGVMFGNPETTTGGRALKFYASVRIDVRRIATTKEGETPIGNRVKFKIVKNKMSPPFRECEADLLFASGFDTVGSVIEAGVANGAIDKSGSWYSFQGARIGQGLTRVIELLKGDPELYGKVFEATRSADKKVAA